MAAVSNRTNSAAAWALLAWSLIAGVCILRVAVALALPLTGDEAYYWEWSRRLAFGYTDHPPMVAWIIALGAPLPLGAFGVRIGCVACGIGATFAGMAAARRLGGSRAGLAAGVALSLAPIFSLAFTTASPDGPFLFFWCVAIWLAVLAWEDARPLTAAALGIALAGALLSRMFGAALALPIVIAFLASAGSRRRSGLLALAVAALLYAPFLFWNATHAWATLAFTFAGRHVNEGFSLKRPLEWFALVLAAFDIACAIGALLALRSVAHAILRWTALPLIGAFAVLALFERVEVYWTAGAFASAFIAGGVAYARLAPPARLRWTIAALACAFPLLGLAAAAGLSSPLTAPAFMRVAASRLRNSGPFEIFTYALLAHDVARIARERSAVVMTDGYGLSALLDFHDGTPPVLIGYDRQGAQAKMWYDPDLRPALALFVDKEPLASRPDFDARLHAACVSVQDGGRLQYSYAGVAARTYYLTWCAHMRPHGLRVLRWEMDPVARIISVW